MQHLHRRLALWDPAQGAALPSLLEVKKDRGRPEVTEEASQSSERWHFADERSALF